MVAKFPKAFQAARAENTQDESLVSAPVAAEPVQDQEIAPQLSAEAIEEQALEDQRRAILAEIDKLPDNHPEKQNLINEAKSAKTPLAASNVMQDTENKIRDHNAAEGQKIQQAMGGGIAAIAGLGALGELSHLEGKLGRDGAIAGGILFKHHNDGVSQSSGIFGDEKSNNKINIASATPEMLFTPFVDPGSRVAAMQPARGLDTGMAISRTNA